jgi:hypothetical protein
MIRTVVVALALTAILAPTAALAEEDCTEAFADTAAKFKTNTIAESEAATAGDLIAQAKDLCGGGPAQQAQAIELLRSARMMIGE